jgi:hypothetical protein
MQESSNAKPDESVYIMLQSYVHYPSAVSDYKALLSTGSSCNLNIRHKAPWTGREVQKYMLQRQLAPTRTKNEARVFTFCSASKLICAV